MQFIKTESSIIDETIYIGKIQKDELILRIKQNVWHMSPSGYLTRLETSTGQHFKNQRIKFAMALFKTLNRFSFKRLLLPRASKKNVNPLPSTCQTFCLILNVKPFFFHPLFFVLINCNQQTFSVDLIITSSRGQNMVT